MLESYTENSRNSRQGQWCNDGMASWQDFAILDQKYVYNFMSNPLSETDEQYVSSNPPGNANTNYPDVFQTKYYAYWDQSKYYQQKAVVDRLDKNGNPTLTGYPHGRISYTDYYPSGTGNGENGQTYKTYSDPYVPSWNQYVPGAAPPYSDWQDNLAPVTTSGDPYSSETVYDSVGRATDVYKMAPSTVVGTFPYNYVHTQTAYYPVGTYSGEPYTVTEDVGDGANTRTTETKAYDSSGHATDTVDAAGHEFVTAYQDADHQVKTITEVDNNQNTPIVTYNYDESGTPPPGTVNDNGQVLNVTDNLSGTEDVFTYDETASDPGVGQVLSTQEESGLGPSYKVTYSYTPDGDRGTTTYATSNGTTQWQYDSYCSVGMPQNGGACSRVPQTMRLLDSSGDPTPEEFHYIYDGGGRMMAASFAMTPSSSYTPPSGQPWYTPTELASSRCHVVYDNDSGGQLLNLGYYWDTWNSGYSSADLFGSQWTYSYTYDQNTWLKTGATLNDFNPHSESYSYDPMLDYLTQATNAGNDGQTENWQYDPAGNRHDAGSGFNNWTFDNLNRLTASPGLTYSNDILGNRLSNSVTSNGWDQLNRMTSFTDQSSNTTNYSYRSDGMRVQKSSSSTSTTFAYDGQMGFEDSESGGSNPGVTDYAVGPRLIDRISFTGAGTTTVTYPIYDGHGNVASMLTASGGSFNAANGERQYDAWGAIAEGQGAGDPKVRYCGNLGDKQDDESSLTNTGQRLYDQSSGRFISEDRQRSSENWFAFDSNDPVNRIDMNGNVDDTLLAAAIIFGMLLGTLFNLAIRYLTPYAILIGMTAWILDTINQLHASLSQQTASTILGGLGAVAAMTIIKALGVNLGALGSAIFETVGMSASAQYCGFAANTVAYAASYCLSLEMIMISMDYFDGN